MRPALDEILSQAAKVAARELDKRLLWDMVCAHADGARFEDMAVGEWPDGAKSVVRRAELGEVPDILGPKRRIRFHFNSAHANLTVC